MKRIAFHTLGCKQNFAETSAISRLLPEDEYLKIVGHNEHADIHVVNTCSVTETADKKCRQTIKHLIKQDPDALMVVMGCYAQLSPDKVAAIEGVDIVLGNDDKFNLASYLSSSAIKRKDVEIAADDIAYCDICRMAWSVGDRTRTFLKIQDGCDYKCSYCTVPYARGRSRNTSIKDIVCEVEKIAAKGIKEVVLTGINTGDFGRTTGETLIDLLKRIVTVEGVERYRLSSIEPNLITDEIIDLVAENDKLMPHFHIPLQSGCNKILRLMRRRYNRETFANKIETIKRQIPFAGIGADVIVGFPNESDTDFEETYTFIESLPLSYLHVFPYSKRKGTVAADMPNQVAHSDKEQRSKRLLELSKLKREAFRKLNVGREELVLFESVDNNGTMSGWSSNYIRVSMAWNEQLVGKIVKTTIDINSCDIAVEE